MDLIRTPCFSTVFCIFFLNDSDPHSFQPSALRANSLVVTCPKAGRILPPLQSASAPAGTTPASWNLANSQDHACSRLSVPWKDSMRPFCSGVCFQMNSRRIPCACFPHSMNLSFQPWSVAGETLCLLHNSAADAQVSQKPRHDPGLTLRRASHAHAFPEASAKKHSDLIGFILGGLTHAY